jgi:hypothetical protein
VEDVDIAQSREDWLTALDQLKNGLEPARKMRTGAIPRLGLGSKLEGFIPSQEKG